MDSKQTDEVWRRVSRPNKQTSWWLLLFLAGRGFTFSTYDLDNGRYVLRVFKRVLGPNKSCWWLMVVIIPPANFVCRGYTVFTLSVRPSVCPSVRASVRPSVTFCFLNNSKSHCWIFIKPCKHVHICKTNTLDKKVSARGQFYLSFSLCSSKWLLI